MESSWYWWRMVKQVLWELPAVSVALETKSYTVINSLANMSSVLE